MEKKILTNEIIESATLLSDVNENSNTRTFLTKENKILKIIPDIEEQHNAYRYNIEQRRRKNKESYILLGSNDFDDFILKCREDMEKKILYSNDFKNIEGISLPTTMYYTNNDEFIGFEQNFINGKNLYDLKSYLKSNRKLSLEILLKLTNIVKTANENGINITDLSNLSNIIITPNFDVMLIDYDDFQINELKSLKISADLFPTYNPIVKKEKYFDEINKKYTSNLDKLSLINTTHILLCGESLIGKDSKTYQEAVINDRLANFRYVEGYDRAELLCELSDFRNEKLKEATKLVFDLDNDNVYPDEAIKESIKRLK